MTASSRNRVLRAPWLVLAAMMAILVIASGTASANSTLVGMFQNPLTGLHNNERDQSQCDVGSVGSLGGGSGGFAYSDSVWDPVCEVFYFVDEIFLGNGKVVATLAIVIAGCFALFGKLTYTQALTIAVGIGMLFGADVLITQLGAPDFGDTAGVESSLLAGMPTDVGANDPIGAVFGNFVALATGQGGRAVAVVLIAIVGVGALYGRVSWTQAVMLFAGVGLVFGSIWMVGQVYTPGYMSYSQLVSDVTTTITSGGDSIVGDPVAEGLLGLIGFMMGSTGIAIATSAVIALGFAAMLGKLEWGRALLVAVGIALLFGATNVVYILCGPTTACGTISSLLGEAISDPFSAVICSFLYELNGPVAKTIATLAIIALGILSMLGKISWELAFVVATGMAMIFGANALVALFNSDMASLGCASVDITVPTGLDPISDVLCQIVQMLYGAAGKALACIAVVLMGFGALFGKVSFTQAAIVAVGISVMFGAPSIVFLLMPTVGLVASTCGVTIGLGGGVSLGTGGFGGAQISIGVGGC